jgi:hypothetical protein
VMDPLAPALTVCYLLVIVVLIGWWRGKFH